MTRYHESRDLTVNPKRSAALLWIVFGPNRPEGPKQILLCYCWDSWRRPILMSTGWPITVAATRWCRWRSRMT